jgi:hypothetical protein
MRVTERRSTNDVIAKGSTNLFVRREVRQENLDDDTPMQGEILGSVDLGGLAHTKQLKYSVPSREGVAERKGWRHRLNPSKEDLGEGSDLDSIDAGQSLPGSTGPKDVTRGVDVGVSTVPTGETEEHRLVYPVTSFDVAALATCLTGVARIHRHYDPTGAFSLVGKK